MVGADKDDELVELLYYTRQYIERILIGIYIGHGKLLRMLAQ